MTKKDIQPKDEKPRILTLNRLMNLTNKYQGDAKRVLCVCSAGLLRSPTAAYVLSNPPFNFNTRSCGVTQEFALIAYDVALEAWAQEIVVMEPWHAEKIKTEKPVICLNLPDIYCRNDPELMKLIHSRYEEKLPDAKPRIISFE